MMNKYEVKNLIANLNKSFEERYHVTDIISDKNGVKLQGIQIMLPDNNVCPVIYLNDNNINWTITEWEEAIDKTVKEMNSNNFDFKKTMTREYVLENVFREVVDSEKCQDYQEKYITMPYLNLLILFRVRIDDNASFLITKSFADSLNISEEELYCSSNKDYEIMSLAEILFGTEYERMDAVPQNILVVSNKIRCYGAGVISFSSQLEEILDKIGESNCYIIPSSIHEVLAVPCDMGNPKDLKSMVCEVNATEVDEQDKLNDSVYYYERGGLLQVIA